MSPEAYVEMAQNDAQHWWYVGRRAILEQTVRGLNLPAGAQILEVGCGTGGNLTMLRQFGRVSAFEMDKGALKVARQKSGLPPEDLRQGACPHQIPFERPIYDLICLFDVLEHIDQDTQTLKALGNLLAEGGRILLTVPAHPWLFGRHDQYSHHKRRYSLPQLERVAAAAQFTVVQNSYFNMLLFPLAVLVRLLDRLPGSRVQVGTQPLPHLLNRLLLGIFQIERFWLPQRRLPFGLSILCLLARK